MPELTESELRNDPLAGELRAYFRATTSTPRPLRTVAERAPAAPPPWHRRPLRAAVVTGLAAVLAAAIAVPVVVNRASTGSGGSSGLLVFTNTSPSASDNQATSCQTPIETEPVSGGPLRSFGSVNSCDANGVHESPVVAGDYLIAPARTAPGAPGPGFDVIDLRTGETHTILLDGLANPLFPSTGPGGSLFPSPDGVDLAVPIQTATNGLPALDIYEMSTGALLRQLEPEVDGSVMSLASSAASSWLSDGIHASLEPCIGAAADSCDYLINPVTGAVRTLVQSNTAAVQDYGSPDGTEEARLSQEVTTTGSRETATVSAGPTGSTLRSVYTSSTAADEMVGALGIDVADDGALMFQTMTVDSKGHPSSVTYVASLGELHRVSLPSVWTLSVPWGCALPGGGFAIEVTRQVGHDTQQEEVLRVSDGGSTTVIQGPTSFASLVGVAS